MKLPLSNVPTQQQIVETLKVKLPKYAYDIRMGKVVDCKQSFMIGATVLPKRDSLIIHGNPPSMGASMVFTFAMIFTGILPILLIWLIAWRTPQNKVRDEVAKVLQEEFGG